MPTNRARRGERPVARFSCVRISIFRATSTRRFFRAVGQLRASKLPAIRSSIAIGGRRPNRLELSPWAASCCPPVTRVHGLQLQPRYFQRRSAVRMTFEPYETIAKNVNAGFGIATGLARWDTRACAIVLSSQRPGGAAAQLRAVIECPDRAFASARAPIALRLRSHRSATRPQSRARRERFRGRTLLTRGANTAESAGCHMLFVP